MLRRQRRSDPDPVNPDNRIQTDLGGFFEEAIGAAGVPRGAWRALAARFQALPAKLRAWRENPSFLRLAFEPPGPWRESVPALTRRFRRTVVFGTGGSALGGAMLVQSLGNRTPPAAHPVQFVDNVDPRTLAALPDPDDTLYLAISKSGNTAETLTQLLTLLPELKHPRAQVRVVSENPQGALAQVAARLGIETLPHPAVGGRFSVLSVVGLLPAALAGVDVDAVLAGARAMAERCLEETALEQNPALAGAAAQYLHAQRGRTLCVHLGYGDRWPAVTHWLRQLWAESLGKRDAGGAAHGLTPVPAHGTADQHSQLQLYLDGPDDKQFTFFFDPTQAAHGRRVPPTFADLPAVAPLAGHTSGELLAAEYRATRETLTRHGRPQRAFELPLEAFALGELIVLLELETVAMAELLGVDPFGQPAVEEGKQLAREYLKK
jgi:glucose-6-phosphate isomerase